MDHMRRKTVRLQQVSMVVLDEADEMLNMGFIEDIETILDQVPDGAQTMLFSATMPKPIQRLAGKFMDSPELIRMEAKEATLPSTEQYYYEVQDRQKFDILCRLLDIQSPDLCIVFARTKRRVDEIFEALSKRGYLAEGIHSDLTQAKETLLCAGSGKEALRYWWPPMWRPGGLILAESAMYTILIYPRTRRAMFTG